MSPRFGPIAFLLLLAAAPAAADTAPVTIYEHGIYAVGRMTHVPAPDQLGGLRWQAPVRLTERTEIVAGQLGRVFGIRVRVNDPALFGKPITIRIRHPKLTAPNGRSATEHSVPAVALPSQPEIAYFSAFEDTYEIAEGDWIFEVVHDGRVLAAQKFRVVVNMY